MKKKICTAHKCGAVCGNDADGCTVIGICRGRGAYA